MAEPITTDQGDLFGLGGETVIPDTGSQPAEEPETTPEPEPKPAAPDIEAINRRVEELAAQNTVLQQRLQDTQQWGNDNRQANTIAQALVQANRAQREAWQAEQEQISRLRPPTLTDEEKEKLGVSDPDLLWNKMGQAVQYGAAATVARLQPYLEQAQAVHALSGPLVSLAGPLAMEQAAKMVERDGIEREEFDGLARDAYQILHQAAQQNGDPAQYTNMILNPQAIATAVSMARRQQHGGVPVARPALPKTAGVGDRTPKTQKPPAVTRSRVVETLERATGVKLNDDDLRKIAERARHFDAQG